MATSDDLQRFIIDPREDLGVEYKNWLDLSANHDKATLAKAAIALANHGGGRIIIGFEENGPYLSSRQRPADVKEITQDDVNAAIGRYAEPRFQCDVHYARHPGTGVSHPIITVPGSFAVPIMTKRACEGVFAEHRYYIRKPGPVSQEPLSADEWRNLINRCVRAAREDMLESFRLIVTGQVETQAPTGGTLDQLQAYAADAHHRWEALVAGENGDAPCRFPKGYYEMSFALVDAQLTNGLTTLKDRMRTADQTNLTGWPPFMDIGIRGLSPRPHEDFLEAWLGGPPEDCERFTGSNTCDYWRASPDGKLYTIRGYDEDASDGATPADGILYVTSPFSEVAEGLLFAHRLAKTYGEVEQIAVYCRFTGLNGRQMVTPPWAHTALRQVHTSATEAIDLSGQIQVAQIPDTLAEWLHTFFQGFYEKFYFFPFTIDTVSKQLQRLRRSRF